MVKQPWLHRQKFLYLFISSCSINNELPWTALDSQLLQCCSVKVSVTEAMQSVIQATSHSAVRLCVSRLSMHFLAEKISYSEISRNTGEQFEKEARKELAREVFYSCDWKTAFER